MKDLIIIGNGSFARLLHYYVTEYKEWKVAAFSVDKAYIGKGASICPDGINVVPFETLEKEFPPENYEVLLGIGYSKMNQVREDLFFRCKQKGYTVASFIHPSALISKGVEMDEGNIILEHSIIQPFVTLGKGNLIWHGVKVAHDDVIGNFTTLCQNTSIAGVTYVGDNCFLGNSCIVLNGLTIAKATLVGAGAIVKKDTEPYEVIVPARSVSLADRKSTDFGI